MLPSNPISQTIHLTVRPDSTGGCIQLLQFAIALREYQFAPTSLVWRNAHDTTSISVELTGVGSDPLFDRLSDRLASIPGVTEVRVARSA